jgi:UDP-N-acetylmuramate dehydrogenase
MIVQKDTPMAQFTSLATGGNAERLYICETPDELKKALGDGPKSPIWILGYGCNSLISDKGLPGTTILLQGGRITREGDLLIADSGVWWDNLVRFAISEQLWGMELMSCIPGSVGAAVRGNIAAYSQAVADTLVWAETLDMTTGEIRRMDLGDLELGYRYSRLQESNNRQLVVLRAGFEPKKYPSYELSYQSVLDVIKRDGLNPNDINDRRTAVIAAREAADSLWDYEDAMHNSNNAGSFFRNPHVSRELAEKVMSFDESGKSLEALKKMNSAHSGDSLKVSAAQVLLAAGFTRGQSWGPVRLSPHHVLKIENTGGATSQQIYDVAQHIITEVKSKLDITLKPEVQILGEFD